MSLCSIACLSVSVIKLSFSSSSILLVYRPDFSFDSSFKRLYTSKRNFGADFLFETKQQEKKNRQLIEVKHIYGAEKKRKSMCSFFIGNSLFIYSLVNKQLSEPNLISNKH